MKLHFQKADIAAIVAVAIVAVFVFALYLSKQDGSASWAEVYQDGKLICRVALAEDREFTVDGRYSNTVTVRDGKIAVTASNCPGEDCVGCGWQDGVGRSIVCLPNGLEIRVVAGRADVDAVVG